MPRKPRPIILPLSIAMALAIALVMTLTITLTHRAFGAKGKDAPDPGAAAMARIRAGLPHSGVRRPSDLVVVLGEKISPLGREAALGRLRVMAFDLEAGWRIIPFQIDERDEEGRWIFPNGEARDDVPVSDGVLSAKDELVFQSRDLGVRAARTAWPKGATGGVEIEVQDPLDRGRGWAYLFLFDAPPPLRIGDRVRAYATSAALGDSVLTPSYTVFYPRDAWGRYVPGVMTEFAIDGKAGEQYGANLLDREKLRYTGALPFFPLFTFRRTEQQIAAQPLGFIDGPLRALRPVERLFHLPWRPDAGVRGMTTFHADRVIIDGPDWIPPRLGFFARKFDLRVSWDFIAPPGSRVHAAPVPLGVVTDGVSEPAEQSINRIPSAWWALSTPRNGALLAIYEHRRRGRLLPAERAYPTLYYRDDRVSAQPGAGAGSFPSIGWHLRARPPGAYWEQPSRVHLFVLESFRPGDERVRLKWIRAPLRVKIGPGLAR